MKELLLDIISKILNYTKMFIIKVKNNIIFEDRKSGVIKVIYNPILEKKLREKNMLQSELNKTKKEKDELDKKIIKINEDNKVLSEKIDGLKAFQKFLLDNHG